MPALINDDNKMVSDGPYYVQGTYKCLVREFGSTRSFSSAPVLFTFMRRQVINGILTLSVNNVNHTANAAANKVAMSKVLYELRKV